MKRGRASAPRIFFRLACKFTFPLQSIVLDCAFPTVHFLFGGTRIGQRHGSEADFLYQGRGETPRAADFVRIGVARRRYRCPESGSSLLDLSAQLQAAGPP